MSKRASGEGTIYFSQSENRWRGSISLGYRNGKRNRKYVSGSTQREVKEKLRRAERSLDDYLTIPPERITLGQFLADWLTRVRPTIRYRTYASYELQVRKHINPALADTKLSRLTPDHLNRLYRTKLEEGLSARSVRYIYTVLRRALGDAERIGLLARNVAPLSDPPRVPRIAVRAFQLREAKAFIKSTEGTRLQSLYLLACVTGLRLGEVLALRWSDIDLARSTVAVRQALAKTEDGWTMGEPKTGASTRLIKLPEFVASALRHHRLRQLKEPFAAAVRQHEYLVFTTRVGTHLDPRNLGRTFKTQLAAAGLDPNGFTFHSLRHSAATIMLAEGVQPKVVQEMLGHSSIKVTMDVYSHVLPHLQDDAAARMDSALGGA